jgi:hypothetical protein
MPELFKACDLRSCMRVHDICHLFDACLYIDAFIRINPKIPELEYIVYNYR